MLHLTEKPVELAARAIQYSSLPGENILDLFGGSGSTLIAAEQTGRRAFLMELDPLYCDIIVRRWEQFTARKRGSNMADGEKPKRRAQGAASPASPKRVSAAAKQVRAMQLREAGVSFDKIAEAVGYANRGAAYKAVMAGLKAARLEPAKGLRRLEMRRLDRLWMALWPLATSKPPDLPALDRCLKIMQRRAALSGLDFHKVALTDPSGEKEFSGGGLTDAQRMAGFRA